MQWQEMTRSEHETVYAPTGQEIQTVFWETICAGEYRTSKVVNEAAEFWKRFSQPTWGRMDKVPSVLDFFSVFYSGFVLLASLTKNDPLFEHRLQGRYLMNRRMVRVDGGYIGLAPHRAVEKDDSIFLLRGSNVPLILRKCQDRHSWTFVGDMYLHGVMHGELWAEERCHSVPIT
jgi:hypothetical protein